MTKSAEAFRTISEVAEVLGTPAHVLRFWESRFTQVRPLKRAGGRRYYRPADVALLGGIRRLLHDDGLTIRGVQKILREQGVRHVAGLSGLDSDTLPERDEPAQRSAEPSTAPASPKERENAVSPESGWPDPVWPAAPDLAPASADSALAPDPDDTPAIPATAAEPPSGPAAPPRTGAPAATLLRAMDALRAHERRGELQDISDRLTRLRDRMTALSDGTAR